MSEEHAFLSAIMANPDDHTTKLVYADWLDERDDPRAEVLRLKVQVAVRQDEWMEASVRLTELEKITPAKWLVILDGPVWCIAGNIVESRPYGPGGAETRHGTRLFKSNAKVYLADIWHSYSILSISRRARHWCRPDHLRERDIRLLLRSGLGDSSPRYQTALEPGDSRT